jgi:hypothetical protein
VPLAIIISCLYRGRRAQATRPAAIQGQQRHCEFCSDLGHAGSGQAARRARDYPAPGRGEASPSRRSPFLRESVRQAHQAVEGDAIGKGGLEVVEGG